MDKYYKLMKTILNSFR